MREIRPSGSEGGGDRKVSPYPYHGMRAVALDASSEESGRGP